MFSYHSWTWVLFFKLYFCLKVCLHHIVSFVLVKCWPRVYLDFPQKDDLLETCIPVTLLMLLDRIFSLFCHWRFALFLTHTQSIFSGLLIHWMGFDWPVISKICVYFFWRLVTMQSHSDLNKSYFLTLSLPLHLSCLSV